MEQNHKFGHPSEEKPEGFLIQLANDHALTILQLSSRINDYHEREVTKILGLVAWGNSQYRLGNHIEGLSSLISVIPFALKLSLIQPLMDSSNIITRWVLEHADTLRMRIEKCL